MYGRGIEVSSVLLSTGLDYPVESLLASFSFYRCGAVVVGESQLSRWFASLNDTES